ncbi:carboxymuconolactone decarboxylase family protein [Burkholderia pseudomallei]|nr:carboxymuconolactone decarboxylase family protein [Burkholderia pseudomallei]CAJ5813666.1 carboxymuconolactone decarboxylase family protein [Burkholderia pseudomallei]CAJ5886407.1 carboxymuconolactone decarboxylase family protein [Burkholderia pseudomallei]CAJ6819902.1 carboxymuconolactone decarboxylase family protein [Burkholderia pseudomallei]CAJ6826935.1 carboxymuconolactone decarboxylase family protein [Burkholderia pseudomallei]
MAHAPRLPYPKLASKPFNALLHLSETVWGGSLGKPLVYLVFLRVSQINGCAYCIDMHWRDLVKLGVNERHLNAVAGWREAPFFDARERAALQWAESVARIPHTDPSDEAFAQLQAHFSDAEIAELGFAIATINAWNLLNVSFRNPIPETV